MYRLELSPRSGGKSRVRVRQPRRVDQPNRVACDEKLLVRGDHADLDSRCSGADQPFAATNESGVQLLIKF